ncbi:MAG: hypothetical protein JXN59_03420 [Anaerolineae bacterium]|nr:hypothetical protein [Anaerolineae bacterium]
MSIPKPELIGHRIEGSLVALGAQTILVCGPAPAFPEGQAVRAPGPLVVRYAVPYLRREVALVPGLFAAEYGAILLGRDAWDYAIGHNNLHPRADLLGLRTDGQPDQVMLRDLDFGRGVEVWAYASEEATCPLARLDALWIGPGAPELPDLLLAYLPRWQRT